MKTRNGFVSNSSSSSFILIGYKEPTTCDCCGRRDLSLEDLGDNQHVIRGATKILKALREEMTWGEQFRPEQLARYYSCAAKMLALIKKGYEPVVIKCEDDDLLLYQIKTSRNMKFGEGLF